MSRFPKELVEAAKQFIDFAGIAGSVADERYIIGHVIVTYDPEVDEWSATGLYDDPREAAKVADANQRELTSDGSPGYHSIVIPVFDWRIGDAKT